jgi:signal transduction histidine kinase
MVNLIGNAVKFTNEGGQVKVRSMFLEGDKFKKSSSNSNQVNSADCEDED